MHSISGRLLIYLLLHLTRMLLHQLIDGNLNLLQNVVSSLLFNAAVMKGLEINQQ